MQEPWSYLVHATWFSQMYQLLTGSHVIAAQYFGVGSVVSTYEETPADHLCQK